MLALLFQSTMFFCSVIGIHWDHSVNLNDDYRLLWTISKPQKQLQQQQLLAPLHPSSYEVTFEVQVRTLGYIGFGFSRDGDRAGADIVIGWVDQGQTYFQVSACSIERHNNFTVNPHSARRAFEPVMGACSLDSNV